MTKSVTYTKQMVHDVTFVALAKSAEGEVATERLHNAPQVPSKSLKDSVTWLTDPENREIIQELDLRLRLGGAYAFLEEGTLGSALVEHIAVEAISRGLSYVEPFRYVSSIVRMGMTFVFTEKMRAKVEGILELYPRIKELEAMVKEKFAGFKAAVIAVQQSAVRRQLKHRVEPAVENLVREVAKKGILPLFNGVVRKNGVEPGIEAGKNWIDEKIATFTEYLFSRRALKYVFALDLPSTIVSATLSVSDVLVRHDQRVAVAKLKRLGFSAATISKLDGKEVQGLVVGLEVMAECGKRYQQARGIPRIRIGTELTQSTKVLEKIFAKRDRPGFNDAFKKELEKAIKLSKSGNKDTQEEVKDALTYESGSKFNRLAFEVAEVGIVYGFAALTGSSPVGYIAKSLATPGNLVAVAAISATTVGYSLYKNPRVQGWVGRIRGLFARCLGRR